MRLKNLDLVGVILVVIINAGLAQLPSRLLIVGIVLAMPLVFVLPGYTLTQVLFRRRSTEPPDELILRPSLKIWQPVSAIDYIVLSLGLSMAIDVLLGFILNVFPIGLRSQSWVISLGLLTTILALLAAYLRRKDIVKFGRRSRPRITIYECILFGLAMIVASVAVWSSILRPPQPQPSFTQFWMIPSKQAEDTCTVLIGVRSYESTSVTYRIVMTINSTQVNNWSPVVLIPQEEWDQSVAIKPVASDSMYIEALLYRADKPQVVFREVHMTLNSLWNKNGQKQQCAT